MDYIISLFKRRKETVQTQEKEILNTRFSSNVELLGNENQSTRISGAFDLYLLANKHPEEYLRPVCEVFCRHVRTITSDKNYQEKYIEKPSKEIQTLLDFLFKKSENKPPAFDDCKKNLRETFLHGVNFFNAKLNKVDFRNTILSDANFFGATLSEVDFSEAKLNDINLSFTSLNKVNFWDAKLNNINFFYARILGSKFWDAKLNRVKFPESLLNDVNFEHAKLNQVDFHRAKLSRVDFLAVHLEEEVNFGRTVLENYSYEEIRRDGLRVTSAPFASSGQD